MRLAVGCGLVVLVWVWPAALALGAAAEEPWCANAGVRVGYSAGLSRCRAYERVSPAGSEPEFKFGFHGETGAGLEGNGSAKGEVQAAVGGDRFGYVTAYPPAGSASDGQYLRVTRGADGWRSEEMIPPQSPDYSVVCRSGYIAAYSPELTGEVLADGVGQPGSALKGGVLECGTDDPPLVAREPQGFQNLFVAERESGPYRLVDEIPEGFAPAGAWFQAASEDLSRVVFTEAAQLTLPPEALAVERSAELTPEEGQTALPDLYEWADGTVRLLTVLPHDEPVEGALANGFLPEESRCCAGAETYTHAVSADGSRVFFGADGDLYLRLNAEQPQSPVDGEQVNGEQCAEPAHACTVQVDAGEGAPEAKGGGGRFMWATPDASRVFFLDEQQLTPDATKAVKEKPDLYEYDVSAPAGERLRDLTPDATEPAHVLGVSGVSEDGSYVYFVADGVLAANKNSYSCGHEEACGQEAVAGEPNLYVAHAGQVTFIATLGPRFDSSDWQASELTSRVTPDGVYLAFNSDLPLTGYDSAGNDEIFLFDAASGELACVSCSPGAPSTASAKIPAPIKPVFGGGAPVEAAGYLQRSLADDGRVFFSTAQQLAGAGNGLSNVYEYDDGVLHLISTGTSGDPSYFYDASADGSDVFFITAQDLPSGGSAGEFMVYDAREDGGFPAAGSEQACAGEAGCRGPAAPLAEFTPPPTTGSFSSGNVPAGSVEVKHEKASKPSAEQVRRERLARALALCRKKRGGHKRSACEAKARRAYATKKTKKTARAAKQAAGGKGER